MSVKPEGQSYVTLECDECGSDLNDIFDREDFKDMITKARSEGWKITRDTLDPDGWVHTCPDCQQDDLFERAMRAP